MSDSDNRRFQVAQRLNGTAGGREATVLVLLLPFLIFCWALAVATIALLV
jgi:hypothetical protein